jgi:hypothetical protein
MFCHNPHPECFLQVSSACDEEAESDSIRASASAVLSDIVWHLYPSLSATKPCVHRALAMVCTWWDGALFQEGEYGKVRREKYLENRVSFLEGGFALFVGQETSHLVTCFVRIKFLHGGDPCLKLRNYKPPIQCQARILSNMHRLQRSLPAQSTQQRFRLQPEFVLGNSLLRPAIEVFTRALTVTECHTSHQMFAASY